MRPDQARPVIDRLADGLVFDGDCLVWDGVCFTDGYGRIRIGSRTDGSRRDARVHVLVFELSYGPVPAGRWVLHHCDNPPCARPDHLYAGTPTQNMTDRKERGRDPRRALTHCKHGHEFTPENTYVRSNGTRHCIACHNARKRVAH